MHPFTSCSHIIDYYYDDDDGGGGDDDDDVNGLVKGKGKSTGHRKP